MTQEEDPEQFQERLSQMKAFNFREQRDDKLKKQIIHVLYQEKVLKPRRIYCISLYCKVFKGLMTYALQLDEFYGRLNYLYINILLQRHFVAIKDFVSIRDGERSEKMKFIVNLRKKRAIGNLRERHNKIKATKVKQAEQEYPPNQTKIRTQSNFYETKPFDKPIEPQINKTTHLYDSRKSSHSLYSALDKPSRRKFVAIKLVPQLPALLSVQQQKSKVIQSRINDQDHLAQKEKVIRQNKEFERSQSNKRSSFRSKSPEKATPTQYKYQQHEQKQKEIAICTKKLQKDKILALLSEISITSWLQMNDIIQDHLDSTLKSQSLLNEKSSLSRSQQIIERISSLR